MRSSTIPPGGATRNEIHPSRIKRLWTRQAVVITPGLGQPAVAEIYSQEARS